MKETKISWISLSDAYANRECTKKLGKNYPEASLSLHANCNEERVVIADIISVCKKHGFYHEVVYKNSWIGTRTYVLISRYDKENICNRLRTNLKHRITD